MRHSLILLFAFSLSIEAKQNRSNHAIKQFKLQNLCPTSGRHKGRCDGYVIGHVIPLACGGLDSPKNMQWQTMQEARAKDRWESVGC